MKLTKKQLSALQKIVGREQARYDKIALEEARASNKLTSRKVAGVHPCGGRYGVTDGALSVLFLSKPDGMADAERMDLIEQYVQAFMNDGDLQLVTTPLSAEDCKKIIAEWKHSKNTIGKPAFPRVSLSVTKDDGVQMVSYFDANLYLNALDVAGVHRNLYLGYSNKIKTPFPCLFIFKQNGKNGENIWDEPIFLMPCRPN